ncbi:MAG TPA: hypothetical protein VN695_01765 [Streptosporangiaceae bacterium]|nr:hypothetical protein [Streptosporangiaceae bacterium]
MLDSDQDESESVPMTGSEPMSPLQNRVLPTGEIVAVPARGLLMGNRGCIHNADRTLGVTRWRTKMWISCVLDWRGRKRDVMPPGRWTALFFLDEATALAAGHRPCGYCRRADHRWFGESWRSAQGLAVRPYAWEMDIKLHSERVDRRRTKLTRLAILADLPDGAMVVSDGQPALVTGHTLRPWSLDGYGPPIDVDKHTSLTLLTPPSIVAALAAGYRPFIHPTASPTTMRCFPDSGPSR